MEQIEYTRTVVPSSMRSSYWKYFGFPSDNGNNILTRQKIVCTLCNTAIAYNKNTSNLRTHLMAKHPETFQKLLTNKRSSNEQEKHESGYKNSVKSRRCEKVEAFNESNVVNISEVQCLDKQEPAIDCEEFDVRIDEISECEEFDDSVNLNQSLTHVDIIQQEVTTQYQDQHQQQQQSLENMLVDMVQKDISLNVIKGPGFRAFNQQVSGLTVDDGTYQRVTAKLRQRITNTQGQITNNVHHLSEISPYSLSIEWYNNSDDLTILNIYFNFFNENQSQLNSILYHTTMAENEINLFEILKDVKIKNCKCIVVNSLANVKEEIADFAKCNDMDLVECLASTLERCLQKIFQLAFVAQNFTELCHKVQQNNFHALNPPHLRILCCWSKLNYLAFVYEHIDDSKWETFLSMKAIYEYIKPLKMALDIISDEQLPLCTLSRPLVIKLFEQHFTAQQTNEFLIQIQMILENELKSSIKRSSFLSEATYFDARFRHEFALPDDPFDLNSFKPKVMERFKNDLDVHYIARCGKATTAVAELTNSKKSNLKTFLNYSDSRVPNKNTSLVTKTNVDVEFEHYHIGIALDLEQSPVKWWQEQAQTYRELNKIVFYYLTTPCCCVHRLHNVDVEQRWQILSRRKQLNHFCDIERHLWYLHYNTNN